MIKDSWSAYVKFVDLSQFSPNVKISRYFKHQMSSVYNGFISATVRKPVQVFAAEKEIPIVKMERIFCFQSLPLITCSKWFNQVVNPYLLGKKESCFYYFYETSCLDHSLINLWPLGSHLIERLTGLTLSKSGGEQLKSLKSIVKIQPKTWENKLKGPWIKKTMTSF